MDNQSTQQFGSRARKRGRRGVGGPEARPLSHYADRLAALQAFAATSGHSLVAQSFVTADGIRLGVWVKSRRQQRGENLALDAALEQLPGWAWAPGGRRRPHDVGVRLDEIEAHMAANGGRPPASRTGLGEWAAGMRAAYRCGELSVAVINACEARAWWSWLALGHPGPITHRPASAYIVELAAARQWATVVRPTVGRWRPAAGEVTLPGGDLGCWIKNRLVVGRRFTHPDVIAELEAMGYVWPERNT